MKKKNKQTSRGFKALTKIHRPRPWQRKCMKKNQAFHLQKAMKKQQLKVCNWPYNYNHKIYIQWHNNLFNTKYIHIYIIFIKSHMRRKMVNKH